MRGKPSPECCAGQQLAELRSKLQEELVDLLKDELSVEERVVTASLKVVAAEMRAGVQGLFALLGVFAEDTKIPTAAIDAIAPLILPDAPEEVLVRLEQLDAVEPA